MPYKLTQKVRRGQAEKFTPLSLSNQATGGALLFDVVGKQLDLREHRQLGA